MSANNTIYCRFCAENTNPPQYIDLASDSRTKTDVMTKLAFFNINIIDFSDKTLPEAVCLKCYDVFRSCYEFFVKIKDSQVVLSNQYKLLKNENVPSSCVKNESGDLDECKTEEIYANYDINTGINTECLNDFVFDTETAKRDVSWTSYMFPCKFCDEECIDMMGLRDHCKELHSSCSGFRCADCHIGFNDFISFVDHAREHRKELIHYCPYCNIKLEDMDHLKLHTQSNCKYCGETFPNDILLANHKDLYQNTPKILKKHKVNELKEFISYEIGLYDVNKLEIDTWKVYPWICQYCCTRFPCQYILRCHVKEVHGKCFGMKCCDCNEVFKTFDMFIEHVRFHRPQLRYHCQYCDAKFHDKQLTNIHINTHLQLPQCESCGESFTSKVDLQRHITAYVKKSKRIPFKKREKPITVEELTCNVCHRVAKSLSNLRAHKLLHTDRNRNYTCDRCGKTFFTKGALCTHTYIHRDVDPEVCKICKKTFLTLTRLKKHVKTHYADKPFECNVCLKRFRLKDHLKGHMITHSDLLPYSCQYCSKGFRHKNVLKTHENLHTGAKPFSCTVCAMGFANWSNCNKHMKRKHGLSLAKNMLTPHGKVPINPKTGKPKKVKDLEMVREWTEQILVPCKRGKKSNDKGTLV
ncbi:gastrula zinc finger protein XlCGF58.1-like [Achroia grisella]|uniref:gastrula zinc finger protein XlCGF58.1-like n=1 Tax=Achroia grisella TaxID=688607 RepID=UPI0027D20ABC|nr:gastrula zinc finger protein XlCGF58.1-like [Achroia grisella]